MKRFQRFRQGMYSAWKKLCIRYLQPGKLTSWLDTLTIELTNRCTLACKCCPNGRDHERCRTQHTLTLNEFQLLLRNLDIHVKRVFLHLHGEPFLNKDMPQIADLLIKRGVEELCIFSNAYHINLSLLEQLLTVMEERKLNIAFSAELYDSSTYESIRHPGRFSVIWQSLERIDSIMARHQCSYTVNAIINASAIDTLKDKVPPIFARLQNMDSIFFSSAFPWPHLPETGEIAGHLKTRRNICSQIWQLPTILASGEVTMCSSDYQGECIVGSLYNHPFSKLMNNQEARRFRRNIALRKADRNQICRECLIDRHMPFTRIVKRTFIEKANAQTLERYFATYHKYFDIDEKI